MQAHSLGLNPSTFEMSSEIQHLSRRAVGTGVLHPCPKRPSAESRVLLPRRSLSSDLAAKPPGEEAGKFRV